VSARFPTPKTTTHADGECATASLYDERDGTARRGYNPRDRYNAWDRERIEQDHELSTRDYGRPDRRPDYRDQRRDTRYERDFDRGDRRPDYRRPDNQDRSSGFGYSALSWTCCASFTNSVRGGV
jgi:hypothetical protein